MVDDKGTDAGQDFLSVLTIDDTCHNDQITCVLGVGHDDTLRVDIIVITILCLDTCDRQSLCESDLDMSSLCLITFGILNKGVLFQRLFYLTNLNLFHRLSLRIDFRLL